MKRKLIIFSIFLVALLAVSVVSAQDNATSTIVSVEENQLILSENNDAGTFNDLQLEINNAPAGSVLNLTRNYIGKEDEVVWLNKDLTIDGQGNLIDCLGDDCSAFYSDGGTITLKNLRFVNGYNDDNYKGGAIYIGDSAQYTIINCTFNNNWADDYGGAIYNGANTLTIINCSFFDNKADDDCGGAIYSKGNLDIKNSTFTYNRADDYGGAVYCEKSVSVENSQFLYNYVIVDGGAIYSKGDVSVKNTDFSNNVASGAFSAQCYGGAIRSEGNVEVNDSTFIDNHAEDYGGAIYAKTASIYSSSFRKNYVKENDGGALYIEESVDIIDSIFEDNYAYDYGGAIHANTASISSSIFRKNYVVENNGGAVYLDDYVDIEDSLFEGNHAKVDGGAIYSKGDVSVKNTTFRNNNATGAASDCFAGAILSKGKVKVDNSTFIGNNAYDFGGAIYANSAYISSSIFRENTVDSNHGGAVYVDEYVEVTDSLFDANLAYIEGGGIYSRKDVSVKNTTFTNNKAWGSVIFPCSGGAISTYDGNVKVDNCTFISNYAYDYGGAIHTTSLTWVDSPSYFIDNHAVDNDGGAIYLYEFEFDMKYGVFINNTADDEGGAIGSRGRIYEDATTITQCYFENNRAGHIGGAIFECEYALLGLRSNVFVNNWGEIITIASSAKYEYIEYNWYGANSFDFTNAFENNHKEEHMITAKMYIDENVTVEKEANLTIYFSNGNTPANLFNIEATFSADNGAVLSDWHTFNGSAYVTGITLTNTNVTHITGQVHNQILELNVTPLKKNLILDAVAEPIYVDENATVVVTGLETATGNITATVNNKTYTSAIKDCEAKVIIPGLTEPVTVNVDYGGDEMYNPASTSVTVTVMRIPTEITLENETFTLNIEDEVPSGAALTPADAENLNYTSSNESIVKVENGIIVAVGEGQANVTVSFDGNDKYDAAESKNITVNVDKRNPVIIASADVAENRVTIHIDIDGYDGLISMDLFDSVVYLPINSSLTFVQTLNPGSYTVNITALGNEKFKSGSGILTFTVLEPKKLNTTIELDADVTENNVTFTVHVNENTTGIVKFELVGSENAIYTDVNDGVAMAYCVVDDGNHTVVATYMGDSLFNSNITSKDFEVVGHKKKDTPITAQASVDENRVTITVSVNDDATGFVKVGIAGDEFYAPIDSGRVIFTNEYSAGIYTANITYLGDYNYNAANTAVQFSIIEHNETLKNTTIGIDVVTGENYAKITVNINETATGLVEVNIDGDTTYLPVNNGQVVYEVVIPAGKYTVTATYLGDNEFNGNTTSAEFTVKDHEKQNTTITTNINVDKNTVTLTVNINENATGFVEISIAGEKYYAPVNAGKAIFTNDYPAGTYIANITYLGDDNFNTATDSATFTIIEHNETKIDTTIDIKVDSIENNVTITANINKNATGLVEFNIDGEAVYIPVNNGIAECGFLLPGGNYTVTATYMGDSKFNPNATSKEFTVKDHEKINTTITTSVNVDKSTATLTVNVNESATGFVEIAVAGKKYYIPVDTGKAIFTNDYPAGTYTADITYLGDDNFNTATDSASFTIIEHNETKMNTTLNVEVESVENNVTITANVNENATGLVEFNIDGEAVYIPVNNGIAECGFLLPGGNYTVTATYMGDSKFNPNATSKEFTVKDHEKINTTITTGVNVDKSTVTLTVNVNKSATGFVEIAVAGKKYYVPVETGKAIFTNDYLPGTYTANIIYLGDDNFNIASDSALFTVIDHNETKMNTTIDVEVESVENNVTITANVNKNATGLVEFNIDGEAVYIPVNNGIAECGFLLPGGNYTVTATYMGDSKFNPNATSKEFTVKDHEKQNATISVEATSPAAGENAIVTVTLPANATGTVDVKYGNGVYIAPVVGGTAVVNIPTTIAGTETASVTYSGDNNYNPTSSEVNITVKVNGVIIAENIRRGVNSPYDYYATLVNAEGKPISDVEITFTIEGKTYKAKTNTSGIATVSAALEVVDGKDTVYNVTITNPYTKENTTATTTIMPRLIVVSGNLTADYLENPPYIVQAIGDDGEHVCANVTVRIVFAGFYYDLLTNATGHVVRTIALAPGSYAVRGEYMGYKTEQTPFRVLQILKASSGTIKKTAKTYTLKATLKHTNGKAISNAEVKLNFNGKNYKVKTNSKGVASYTIKSSVIKKLKAGKTYVLKALYINDWTKGQWQGKIKVVK